jgi:putative cell wall-binding protein
MYMFAGESKKGTTVNPWKLLPLLILMAVAIPASAQEEDSQEGDCVPVQWYVVANGHSDSDIGVAANLASHNDVGEVFYVARDHVPEATRQKLESMKFGSKGGSVPLYVVGGEDAITEETVRELMELAPFEAIRLGGRDRFATAGMAMGFEPPCRLVQNGK